MVKNNSKNKWCRRYRTFFIIGVTILSFQIFLAVKFLSLSNKTDNKHDTQWEPSAALESNDGSNSARRIDDEETNLITPKTFKLNQTQLQLDFQIPCRITAKEAVSAINRAKTEKCKQMLSNITCLSQVNRLYPKELKSSCPSQGFKSGRELGCFKDEKDFRLLNGYFGVNKKDNSPQYCINLCLQSGFPYAGVQYSDECFCGVDEPPLASKIPDSSCNMKCPGGQQATCGGYYTINVYETGIKKFSPQTANESSEDRKQVKIAFLLTLNGRALRQVKRLIKILYHKDHFYYIHVDVRQDYLFRELLVLEKLPNVRLTRNRFATIWGGASLLKMLTSCMSELLAIEHWQWQFVLNLSESDYPVKTVTELTRFLSANKNRNFVKSHGREVQRFIQKQGLDKTFVECEHRMWRIGNRVLPNGIQVDGGSDWIALSRTFVEYIASPDPDDLIVGLLEIFHYTLLPAETFFHTALRNSKFCNTYIDNNLHVTNWKRKLGCKCQYKHVVDWCGCSPNDFRVDDWSKILNTQSRQLYFARKFEPIVNQEVILQLELWLVGLDKPSRFVENLDGYWQNIYHHKDLGVTFDEGLMTLSKSIERRGERLLSNSTSSVCEVSFYELSQIHSFHYKDRYKYTLFYYETSMGNIEVAVKPSNKLVIVKPSPLMEHLRDLSVSSDYDQKEQISRNFVRVLTPFSEPVLVYHFESHRTSKQYNLTCLWIDPVGNLQEVTEFSVDESNLVGHVKSGLKQPLVPGIWTTKLIYKNGLLAKIPFLITPLEFSYGKPFKGPQISLFKNSPTHAKDVVESYSKFLPNSSQKNILEEQSFQNLRKTDKDMLDWIDKLVQSFYSVANVCVHVKNSIDICGNKINACSMTNWSSLAPDPKSAISIINETTGMFDIW